MFFWLDPKEPKSQERKDIQHFSFFRLDLAVVLLWLQLQALMNNSKFLRIINVMNSKVRKSNLEFGIREKALKNFLSEALSSEDFEAHSLVIH